MNLCFQSGRHEEAEQFYKYATRVSYSYVCHCHQGFTKGLALVLIIVRNVTLCRKLHFSSPTVSECNTTVVVYIDIYQS